MSKFTLFNTKKRLEHRIAILEEDKERLLNEREKLQDENFYLKEDNATAERKLKTKDDEKRRFEENLSHKAAMLDEKRDVQWEKKEATRELELEKARNRVKEEYRNKLEGLLEGRAKEIREMYSEILAVLPNVNVMLGNSSNSEE